MKQTSTDAAYAEQFGRKLRPFFKKLVEEDGAQLTFVQFAQKLGVSHGALPKYLRGKAMPSLRTIVRAYDEFGILVPYEERSIGRFVKGRRKGRQVPIEQLSLPLTIASNEPSVDLQVARKSAAGVTLELRFRRSG